MVTREIKENQSSEIFLALSFRIQMREIRVLNVDLDGFHVPVSFFRWCDKFLKAILMRGR